MSEERTVQCPICKRPYVFYPFSATDQSACPSCVAQARENMKNRIFITRHTNSSEQPKQISFNVIE